MRSTRIKLALFVSAIVLGALPLAGCTAVDNFGFTFSDMPGGDLGVARDAASPAADGAASSDGGIPTGPCGGAYQRCCASAPQCAGGGCCDVMICKPSGTNVGSGQVCSNGAAVPCGLPGEPCCGLDTCHNGGCCVGGLCAESSTTPTGASSCGAAGSCNLMSCQLPATTQACGGSNQPCCNGTPSGGSAPDFCVASGLACNPDSNRCEACGGPGQVCCEGSGCASGCCDHSGSAPTCLAENASCSGGQGSCTLGGCTDKGTSCGRLGESCCGDSVGCTSPLTLCQGGSCVGCGGEKQPCCAGGYCAEPFACASGTCAPCGTMGEPCCPGGICRSVGTGQLPVCSNGMCG